MSSKSLPLDNAIGGKMKNIRDRKIEKTTNESTSDILIFCLSFKTQKGIQNKGKNTDKVDGLQEENTK